VIAEVREEVRQVMVDRDPADGSHTTTVSLKGTPLEGPVTLP